MKEGKFKMDRVTLLSGLGLLMIVTIMGTALFGSRMSHGREVRTRANVTALESAVAQFEMEYGRIPDVGSSAFDTDGAEGYLFAVILFGKEGDEIEAQNPRNIPFLTLDTGRNSEREVLRFGRQHEFLGIYDEWGEPFQILLRKPGERGITLVHRGKTVTLERSVLVFSKGEDRIAGTKDDVRTWE
jgi:hypothetical protein